LVGGLPEAAEDELTNQTLAALQKSDSVEPERILPIVASRTVNAWASGKKPGLPPAASFATKVSGLSETLAGLSARPRAARSTDVQEHYAQVLTDSNLLAYLQEHLLAQDRALDQLAARLRMECLTRPRHQPLRYCAQGTPATGKSESAALLARRLGIPHINIDAASLPDYYTAAAQLLGSGRGIVGSYQSGRLEQAAKHHTGALIEVSDLDHATPQVRAVLGDLFLQVLETGEAQSAAGAMFSCANLIFAFTMNLPDGMDEAVRKGIGFNQAPSDQAVRARVAAEIKRLLSSAFLSRIGTPILFAPLSGEALAAIIERAIKSAVQSAVDRLHLAGSEVVIAEGVGARVVSVMEASISSFGARALLEHGRALAAQAVIELQQTYPSVTGQTLMVSASPDGRLMIKAV
jgi:ATP-dependent Clp protease ATP-binding subunit ClpA